MLISFVPQCFDVNFRKTYLGFHIKIKKNKKNLLHFLPIQEPLASYILEDKVSPYLSLTYAQVSLLHQALGSVLHQATF